MSRVVRVVRHTVVLPRVSCCFLVLSRSQSDTSTSSYLLPSLVPRHPAPSFLSPPPAAWYQPQLCRITRSMPQRNLGQFLKGKKKEIQLNRACSGHGTVQFCLRTRMCVSEGGAQEVERETKTTTAAPLTCQNGPYSAETKSCAVPPSPASLLHSPPRPLSITRTKGDDNERRVVSCTLTAPSASARITQCTGKG